MPWILTGLKEVIYARLPQVKQACVYRLMDNRQRVLNAFEHGNPDRTPFFEYCLHSKEIARRVLGRPCSYLHLDEHLREDGWEKTVLRTALDRLEIAQYFGHDMLSVPRNPAPPARGASTEPCAAAESPEDPVENIARRNKAARENPEELAEGRFLVFMALKEEMGRRKLHLPILAPAYTHGIWTDTDLMQTMILAPEAAQEHFSIATKKAEKLIDKYLELGIEMIGIGGDFAGNSPIISPAAYKTFITPELKKLSARIHAGGAYAVNASDGNLWSVIDDFLVASGVDGYLEIDLHAGMDLKKLKDEYGDAVTFLGNMDCGNTLSFSSPEEIRDATIKCIEAGLGNGGHIFTASNAITDSVPVENYFAMVNAFREYWSMPELKNF